MQLWAKFKKVLVKGFRATLNRKFVLDCHHHYPPPPPPPHHHHHHQFRFRCGYHYGCYYYLQCTGLMLCVFSATQVDICKRVIHLYRSVVLEVPMEPSTW